MTFDDLSAPDRPLTGPYPAAVANWGGGAWYLSSPYGRFTTQSVSYNGPAATSATVSLLAPQRVVQIDAYNGGSVPSTITLSCAGLPTVQSILPVDAVQTITTGWATTCSGALTIGSTNGWDTNFDNLVLSSTAAGSATTTPTPTVTPSPTPTAAAATATPAVTPTAPPTVTPSPTPTAAVATVTPTVTPTAPPTVTPSPTPTAVTPTPTATTAGATVTPTVTSTATSTPAAATATPTVTASVTPTATPTGVVGHCPCTLFAPTAVPANPSANDTNPVELGVKFTSDTSGVITGLRFYKSALNTGTHVASLWSSTGTLLAQATFTAESVPAGRPSTFTPAVAVTANTTYVASYHTTAGHYAADQNYFNSAVNNPPLHGVSNGGSGGNGVYAYAGGSTFPNSTYMASNYWVDPIFDTTVSATATPTPAPAATSTPTNTPVGAATSTPTPTSAPAAAATSTPTPTSTPAAAATSTPTPTTHRLPLPPARRPRPAPAAAATGTPTPTATPTGVVGQCPCTLFAPTAIPATRAPTTPIPSNWASSSRLTPAASSLASASTRAP